MATLRILPVLDPPHTSVDVCIECTATAVEGKTRCERHLHAARDASARFRSRQREKVLSSALADAPLEPSAEVEQGLKAKILAHIAFARDHESNAHLRDDYAQTSSALARFWSGEFLSGWDALVWQSYLMYGCHPNTVWDRIVSRRQWMLGNANVVKFPRKPIDSQQSPAQKQHAVKKRTV